jgi:hypothetical protein
MTSKRASMSYEEEELKIAKIEKNAFTKRNR